MKKNILTAFFSVISCFLFAQSGEITTKGVVYPQYTTANRPTGLITPGTTIFNTTLNTHQYYNGSTWVSITNATGNSPWTLTGNNVHNNSGVGVGINSPKPVADLEVLGSGGLLVNQPYTVNTSTPAPAVTMPYSGTLSDITSPAGRILDPGGTGNYLTNTNYQSYIRLNPTGSTDGFRFTFESLQLETGAALILSTSTDLNDASSRILEINKNSNYVTGKPFLISEGSIYIHFIITSGGSSAPGFQLLFEQVTLPDNDAKTHSEIIGRGLSFSREKSSFSFGYYAKARGSNSVAMGYSPTASGNSSTAMGYYTRANGDYSTALGSVTTASGISSTAMGYYTRANGDYSTALGFETTASGNFSTAMGSETTASGNFSTAMGSVTTASGNSSTAMGSETTASGNYSTAMGSRVSTNEKEGAFIIGDSYNGSGQLNAGVGNRFYARFRRGYYLYTNALSTLGLALGANATSWNTLSDSTRKERFIPANHEQVLNSVSQMRIGTWNYIDDTENRHWGVMAQDFFKHFGKDKYGTIGNDTTIATADFDGVAFAAIKGLEERTRELQEALRQAQSDREKLKMKNETQQQTIASLLDKIEKLENMEKENKAYFASEISLIKQQIGLNDPESRQTED